MRHPQSRSVSPSPSLLRARLLLRFNRQAPLQRPNLYDEHDRFVRGCARDAHWRPRPHFDQQDVDQEAWLTFLRSRQRYNPTLGASLQTFARPRVKYRFVDLIRHEKVPTLSLEALAVEREAPEHTETSDDVLDLRAWMGTLTERERIILKHKFWDGMSDDQIGKSLTPTLSRARVGQILKELYQRGKEDLTAYQSQQVA